MAAKVIKKLKEQRKDPVSPLHLSEPQHENLSRDEGFHETARKDSLEREQEENLLRDEGFHETAEKDSLEREQGITKVLKFKERTKSFEFFLSLVNSGSSECPFWEDSEDQYDSSFSDDSSPSELSASIGYFPPFQSCEDSSDIPVQQISINNEETSRTTDSGRYNQNKETSGQGIIIKIILPTPHNVSTVRKCELDMPLKDIKPSELATVEENFQDNLEDLLEPGIREMSFNIQQGIWRKTIWHHQKPSRDQYWRNKIELEKQHQIKLRFLADFMDPRREPWYNSSESQSILFDDPPSQPSSFHRLFRWIRKTFSRANMKPLEFGEDQKQRVPRSRGSRLWRWLSWKSFN
ncbi:uncharacterized protein [Notamacropus eugenii]|uniref:uncharacterized protein isoform X2 n=1 Tax=Notamacropus eugenii TaxID=9315 RepID=UPI003B66EB72